MPRLKSEKTRNNPGIHNTNKLLLISIDSDFFKVKDSIIRLKKRYNISNKEIFSLIEGRKICDEVCIPISAFDNDELGCLETIVKYLKEEFNFRFHQIALILNRDDRTIWATYNAACKKRQKKLDVKESQFFIPTLIFKDRRFSVLESIVRYLKDDFNLRYSEISNLLNRDQRNIWTICYRAAKKKK